MYKYLLLILLVLPSILFAQTVDESKIDSVAQNYIKALQLLNFEQAKQYCTKSTWSKVDSMALDFKALTAEEQQRQQKTALKLTFSTSRVGVVNADDVDNSAYYAVRSVEVTKKGGLGKKGKEFYLVQLLNEEGQWLVHDPTPKQAEIDFYNKFKTQFKYPIAFGFDSSLFYSIHEKDSLKFSYYPAFGLKTYARGKIENYRNNLNLYILRFVFVSVSATTYEDRLFIADSMQLLSFEKNSVLGSYSQSGERTETEQVYWFDKDTLLHIAKTGNIPFLNQERPYLTKYEELYEINASGLVFKSNSIDTIWLTEQELATLEVGPIELGEQKDSSNSLALEYQFPLDPQWNSDTTKIEHLSPRKIMDRILPQVIDYAQNDTITEVFYNNVLRKRFPEMYFYYIQEDSSCNRLVAESVADENNVILLIGKFIDDKQTFAVLYTEKGGYLTFYRLHENKWKEIGKRKPQIDIQNIYLEEFNTKPGLEIVASTHWNMNGNSWKELFVYLPEKDKIEFAGDFCTDYRINLDDTTVTEEYGGSWYMDNHKTLYVWHNNMLVPLKKSVYIVSKNWENPEEDPAYLEYYENSTLKYPAKRDKELKLIFKERYDATNPKHQKYWDNFFEIGKRD